MWHPEIVFQGHQSAFHTDDAFFAHIAAWETDYATLHRQLLPLGDEEVHFDLDSWGGWLWPYRTHLATPEPFTLTATVRNPLPEAAALTVRLVGPEGWVGETKTLSASARVEVACELSITPSGFCRRQPIAVELTAAGRPFGQVAEALVTIGEGAF